MADARDYKMSFNFDSVTIHAEWTKGKLSVEINGKGSYLSVGGGMWFSLRTMVMIPGDTIVHTEKGLNLHTIGQACVDRRYKEELLKTVDGMG